MTKQVEKSEAIKNAREAIKNAEQDLDNFNPIHEIEIKEICKDKDGNDTKVLILDTDKEGYLGMLIELGNPFSFGADGEPKEDSKKLMKYLHFMVNIDLNNTANLRAVGQKAIMKVRRIVSDFFMLNLVSSMSLDEMEEE